MAKKSLYNVNNRQFAEAVGAYVEESKQRKLEGKEPKVVSDYIAECFMRISEGQSHLPQFRNYTFREDMASEGVLDCLKRIQNFNPEMIPENMKHANAFSYFYQIVRMSFIQRIKKEAKQQKTRRNYINQVGIETFISNEGLADVSTQGQIIQGYVDELRDKFDKLEDYREPSDSATTKVITTKAPKYGKRRKPTEDK